MVKKAVRSFVFLLYFKPDNYRTSGFCPGRLFSLGLCAGLRVVVLAWLLLFVLLLLGPFAKGFLKALGRLIFALGFVPCSELTDWDTSSATEKKKLKTESYCNGLVRFLVALYS